jgi:hypothetical protein
MASHIDTNGTADVSFYASYIDEPVVRKGATSTSTVHFYHRNQQYSVTAINRWMSRLTGRFLGLCLRVAAASNFKSCT